jgi:hypothetical protein
MTFSIILSINGHVLPRSVSYGFKSTYNIYKYGLSQLGAIMVMIVW